MLVALVVRRVLAWVADDLICSAARSNTPRGRKSTRLLALVCPALIEVDRFWTLVDLGPLLLALGVVLAMKRPRDGAVPRLILGAADGLVFVIRVVAGVSGFPLGLLRVGDGWVGVDAGRLIVIGLPIIRVPLNPKRGLGLGDRVCRLGVEGDVGLLIPLLTGEGGLEVDGAFLVIDGGFPTVPTDGRLVLLMTVLLLVLVLRLGLVVGRLAALLLDELLLRAIRLDSPPQLGLILIVGLLTLDDR
ncbi:MAG: hypothetical protein JSU70_19020 [Phycisphaerales bacterium]|nr:MAG: hypothetical protein JSU70_19020 [Phycisphaerales bacterium]